MAKQTQPQRPDNMRIALLLQGGGALGAYQAGVYQALQEHDFAPDSIVGTSIGAINGAIVAGNAPEDRVARLRDFWEGLAQPDIWQVGELPDAIRPLNSLASISRAFALGLPGMFTPRSVPLAGAAGVLETPSFYDNRPLRETLERLVDFELINQGAIRLGLSAVHVTTGTRVFFDNTERTIGPDHVLASGALPPGFPAVRVDGELYWDGGLYANTPLDRVLNVWKGRNALCFVVDLWDPRGHEPATMEEVMTRYRQLSFSSRSKQHIEDVRHIHDLRNVIRRLRDCLSDELLEDAGLSEVAAELGHETTMHILRLGYPDEARDQPLGDVDFASASIESRWNQGYRDAERALQQPAWLDTETNESGIAIHDVLSE